MNINLIASIGRNYEIGKNNDIIWHLKEDMDFFKKTTTGHMVVMGRKTFESLPKVLPNRKNIVISSNDINNKEIEIYKSIKEFLLKYKNYDDPIFIIGGASLYEKFLPLSNMIYLTEINAEDKDANVYFPKFNKKQYDSQLLFIGEENNIEYKRMIYKKR